MALKTQPPPRSIDRESTSYKWWVALAVTLSSFLVNMSQFAVQLTVPPIMTAFGLSVDQAQWLITGYAIAGAMLMPTLGWLGNRLGNRTLYLCCMLIFTTGAGLCATAWSGPSLIAFRVLQGMGGGLILPMTMTIVSGVFPPEQRGIAVGIIGIGIALGPALGPVIGGYLTEHLSWRMVFVLTVILGIMFMTLTGLTLSNTREAEQRSLDLMGLLLMSVTVVSLLVALSRGHREGWDTALIQRLFLTAGVGLALFVIWESHVKDPLIDLRIYRNATFCGVSMLLFMFLMTFFTSHFLQTILLQRLLDYTPIQAGFALLPSALVVVVVFPIAGRLSDIIDRRLIIFVALCLFIVSSYGFTFLSLDWPLSRIMWLMGLRFIAASFVFTAANSAALSQLPPDRIRMGSGLLNLVQNGLGGTLGLAIGTTFLQRRLTVQTGLLDQQQLSSSLGWSEILMPVRDMVQQAGAIGPAGEAQVAAIVQRHLSQQASVAAYQDCFVLMTLLGLLSILLLLLLRKPKSLAI
ncbi:DHA2 family efflux MFS transporter permease subunit [Candidatus Entotheonella palauensis]|uniref:DHA2 family efflux MFS transporter permease subunit n=1 Tax=Candidatus Entotheonella palauensis TaxID=93172 RepID=UPI001177A398|nr:DHA2 family efflux MFS transporter permease subunit [Candidatus Entotheonella palauensis]